jgi:hypothetical protein
MCSTVHIKIASKSVIGFFEIYKEHLCKELSTVKVVKSQKLTKAQCVVWLEEVRTVYGLLIGKQPGMLKCKYGSWRKSMVHSELYKFMGDVSGMLGLQFLQPEGWFCLILVGVVNGSSREKFLEGRQNRAVYLLALGVSGSSSNTRVHEHTCDNITYRTAFSIVTRKEINSMLSEGNLLLIPFLNSAMDV